ncbi:MAG: uroporphyrinogen-III C-methyltransferase [Gammaproteobacteria bacterium]|nr:uroporphyrinogen-III C-methyltransferase [Gammaproteobacteria bacterium]
MSNQHSEQASTQVHGTDQDTPADAGSESVSASGSGWRGCWVLWVLVVVVAAAALYGVWRVVQQQQVLGLQLDELRADVAQEDHMLQGLRDEQQAMQADIGDLRTGLSKGALVRAVTEASFLVRIAHDHLVFAYDLPGAVNVLGAAEQVVGDVDDVRLVEVKRQLADTLQVLRQVDVPDISRLALQLKRWAARAQELPLAQNKMAPVSATPATEQAGARWQVLLYGFWAELKSLVAVRQGEQVTVPLITPEQQYFLYQNLRLELGAAQISLLHRDPRNLRASLSAVRDWVNRYFDVRSANTKALLAELDALEKIDVAPALPELSSLQQALHDVLAAVRDGDEGVQKIDATDAGRVMESGTANTPL